MENEGEPDRVKDDPDVAGDDDWAGWGVIWVPPLRSLSMTSLILGRFPGSFAQHS